METFRQFWAEITSAASVACKLQGLDFMFFIFTMQKSFIEFAPSVCQEERE